MTCDQDLYTGDPQEAGHGTREPLLDTSQDTVTSDPGDKTAASQDISPGSQVRPRMLWYSTKFSISFMYFRSRAPGGRRL